MDYGRVIGVVIVVGLVLLSGCGGGGGSGGPAVTGPAVSGLTIGGAPKFTGGPVTLSGHVTASAGVSTVVAKVTRPEGTMTSVPLSNVGGDLYTGVFNAPANDSTAAKTYSVVIVAADSAGRSTTSVPMTFSVPCPVAPPPPPA